MFRSMAVLGCLVLLSSCDELSKQKASEGVAATKTTSAAAEPAAGIPVATAGSKVAPHGGGGDVSGVVLETMDAGKYTYVRLEGAGGKQWAAVPKTKLQVGQRVTVKGPMVMRDFHSKTLNRDFAQIYFGTLDLQQARAEGGHGMAAENLAGAHRTVTGGDGPIKLSTPVEKAEGGKTIAEIYANKTALAGKTVRVRGKVVKLNNGIMGRNWAHLQDGSRSGDSGFDLTITTSAQLQLGQVVEVSGTLAVDRDFGAGYRYAVILEQATVR